MALSTLLESVVAWVRKGYPDGVPRQDYIPLLALLKRRMTSDELAEVAHEIAGSGDDDAGLDCRRDRSAYPRGTVSRRRRAGARTHQADRLGPGQRCGPDTLTDSMVSRAQGSGSGHASHSISIVACAISN